MNGHWKTDPELSVWIVDGGIVDVSGVLRLLPGLFPNATVLHVEGNRIGSEAIKVYEAHIETEPNSPRRQATWSPSWLFNCRCSPLLFVELARVGESHAPHELFDGIALYAGDDWLLTAQDAFASPFSIGPTVPETTLVALVAPFGVGYVRVEPPTA